MIKERILCLKDVQNIIYIFKDSDDKKREIYIDGKLQGLGSLITPLDKLKISGRAFFKIGEKGFSTNPLKGILLDEIQERHG